MKNISRSMLESISMDIWKFIQKNKTFKYIIVVLNEYGKFFWYGTNDFNPNINSKTSILVTYFTSDDTKDIDEKDVTSRFIGAVSFLNEIILPVNRPMMFNDSTSFLLFHNGFVLKIDISYTINHITIFDPDEAHVLFLNQLRMKDQKFFLTNKPTGTLSKVKNKLYSLGIWTARDSDQMNCAILMDLLNDKVHADRLYLDLKSVKIDNFYVRENPDDFKHGTVCLEIYKKDDKVTKIELNSY